MTSKWMPALVFVLLLSNIVSLWLLRDAGHERTVANVELILLRAICFPPKGDEKL